MHKGSLVCLSYLVQLFALKDEVLALRAETPFVLTSVFEYEEKQLYFLLHFRLIFAGLFVHYKKEQNNKKIKL